MADAKQPRPDSGSGAGKAAIIAAAVLIITPITASQEGFVSKAKPDPAHIPTYCYGETENVDPERIYTKSKCMELLRRRLARDYAPKVLECLPQLMDARRKFVFAALIDASYNAGPGDPRKPKTGGVCNSPMAVRIRADNWTGACNAFVGWYTTAKNRKTGIRKEYPGLVKRRRDVEKPLCLKGAILPPIAVQPSAAPPPQPTQQQTPPPPPHVPSLLERFVAFVRHLLGARS